MPLLGLTVMLRISLDFKAKILTQSALVTLTDCSNKKLLAKEGL